MNPENDVSTNQRQRPRRKSKRTTRVSCHRGVPGAGINLAVALLDLSETGVRLLLSENVEPGQLIEVRFLGLSHYQPLKLAAEVIWSIPTADRAFCLGARFHQTLNLMDLQRLAALAPQGFENQIQPRNL
jgi:hypothetical protein